MQASVREVMNALLEITKDADILIKPPVDHEDIEAFENDRGLGPSPPYLLDLSNARGAWNHALLLIFMEEYVKKFTVDNEEEQDEISTMFLDRVSRLRKMAKHAMRLPGETNPQLSQRYLAKHITTLKEQRRNSRRNEVYSTLHFGSSLRC